VAQHVEEAGVQFVKDNPYETLPTVLDRGRIQQIVTNFVSNAIKYTHEGHIKVGYRIEQRDGRSGLYVYCEDTGAGIPSDKQASVFDRFVKLDDRVQGTGLGLSICKNIVNHCGGQIGVHSDGADCGSTFWFWIPCELPKNAQ
jgi:signal transduction histidine kinase